MSKCNVYVSNGQVSAFNQHGEGVWEGTAEELVQICENHNMLMEMHRRCNENIKAGRVRRIEDIIKELRKGEEDVAAGRVYAHEDVKKEMEIPR